LGNNPVVAGCHAGMFGHASTTFYSINVRRLGSGLTAKPTPEDSAANRDCRHC